MKILIERINVFHGWPFSIQPSTPPLKIMKMWYLFINLRVTWWADFFYFFSISSAGCCSSLCCAAAVVKSSVPLPELIATPEMGWGCYFFCFLSIFFQDFFFLWCTLSVLILSGWLVVNRTDDKAETQHLCCLRNEKDIFNERDQKFFNWALSTDSFPHFFFPFMTCLSRD